MTSKTGKPERDEVSMEVRMRKEAVRYAIASTNLEGQDVGDEMKVLFERWSNGELSNDELIGLSIKLK